MGAVGFMPPLPSSEPALAAENELLEGRETTCDESLGFVQSLPRTEGNVFYHMCVISWERGVDMIFSEC